MMKDEYIRLLKSEVVPALGCTEPVCLGLCASYATDLLREPVVSIHAKVSGNVYKNAAAVGIPNYPKTGVKDALILGALLHNPTLQLKLFEAIDDSIIQQVATFNNINIEIIHTNSLYVEVIATSTNHKAKAIITESHTHLSHLEFDDEILYQDVTSTTSLLDLKQHLTSCTLKQIRSDLDQMTEEDLSFLLDGVKLNMDMAEYGLKTKAGIGISNAFDKQCKSGMIGMGLQAKIMALVTAASESRMAGSPLPVMSSCGSGNHGITAIIPIAVTADWYEVSKIKELRALAFSHLLNIYIKHFTGKLSATCGCGVSAATAACASMIYMLDGTDEQIAKGIINMTGTITGMICDGGKIGCSLKLMSAVSTATVCAGLALDNICLPKDNGIVDQSAEDCIKHMGEISQVGMDHTDETILKIMAAKV